MTCWLDDIRFIFLSHGRSEKRDFDSTALNVGMNLHFNERVFLYKLFNDAISN